jgi:hypothetical protein
MVALPSCHFELLAAKPRPSQYPTHINSLGDHIRVRRLDLKLLQKQVADQIEVHEQTIGAVPKSDPGDAIVARRSPEIVHFHVQPFDFAIPDPPGLWSHSHNAT